MLCLLTRGHPLFTIELLRGMQERGDLVQDENGYWVEGPTLDWEALPARVEAVIAERIGRLDRHLQATLRTASVEGELFTAEVVARVQVRPEIEILERLSDEVDRKHHLIHAQSIQRIDGQLLSSFRFRHSLVQKYLYNSLDEVERVHLHEQVGSTIEELYANQMEIAPIVPQLARHFQEAHNIEKALHYLQLAGERALQVSAYQEAITHLKTGLTLLVATSDPSRYAQQDLALQLSISMALHLSAHLPSPELEKASARALELSQQIGNTTQLCQVLTLYSIFQYVKSEYQKAQELAEKALIIGQQSGDWESVPKFVGEYLQESGKANYSFPVRFLAHSRASCHQSRQQSRSRFVTAHRSAAHFHPPNHLLGGVIRPRHLWLPVKDAIRLPMLAQADQQIAQLVHRGARFIPG
jgi:predicted ATPase